MECWLAGAYGLENDAALARSCSLHFRVYQTSLRAGLARVRGSLHASGLAEDAPFDGAVTLRGGRAHYGLRFDDDAGRRLELSGEQEIALRRPPRGFSVVLGSFLCDGQRIGRVRLRLDPRNGMKGIFSWDAQA